MDKFLAVYDDAHGKRQCWIYNSYPAYYSDTFSPDCEEIFFLDLSGCKGKTYAERKAYIEDKAIEYSNNMGEIYPISQGEIIEIEDYFYKYGKRYGLLREFRKNCIC